MKKVNFKESQDDALVGDVKSIAEVSYHTAFHDEIFIDILPFVLPEPTGLESVDKFMVYSETQLHKLRKDDTGPCIVGIGFKDKEIKNHSKLLSSNDTQMFLSVINLISEKDDSLEISNSRLLWWLRKYGIPQLNNGGKRIWAYVFSREKYCMCSYIPVKDFSEEVKDLYSCFNLWKAACEDDKNRITKYAKLLGYNLHIVKKAYSLLTQKIDKKLKGINSKFIAIPEYTLFYNKAESIFNLLYYQLACYISRKDRHIGKSHLRTCKRCGDIFWASHGNDDYCGKYTGKKGCNKSAAHMKNARGKKN